MARRYERALITGASSGIGRAMALWWTQRGTKVFAAARRTQLLDELAAESGGLIEPIELDVTDGDNVVHRVQELDAACGGLDLVIANAGVGDPTPARTSSWGMVQRVLDVNVIGAA